jgi:hypothetical protein
MSKSRKPRTFYLVERQAYRVWAFQRTPFYGPCSYEDDEKSYTPVKAFADEDEATAYRARLEAEARADLSPALFCEYDVPSGLAERLREMGYEPPRFGKGSKNGEVFRLWWARHAAEITPEQQAAIWELFPDVAIYRVSKISLAD